MPPTVTEDTKQQCESKPKCRWREVNHSICVDNNSNRLSDVACSSIGPKLDCNRPQTPPPPPGPPAQLKINGQCKTYQWSHTSQPATSTANGCVAGDYLDDADTNTYWQWKCKGKNWGSEAICKAPKKIDGKCWSSYMTCQVWTPTNWSEETKGGECYTRTKFRWECWWIGGGRQDSCIEIEEERDRGSWC